MRSPGNNANNNTSQAGRELPQSVRHQMEARFGTDFADVRVHESHRATVAGATSFTDGNDIFFKPGEYDPFSKKGRELIGHELAHVVQQRGPGNVRL